MKFLSKIPKKVSLSSVVLVALLLALVGGQSMLRAQTSESVVINNYAEGGIVLGAGEGGLLGGTRFPNGLSADSTSPVAGQVRGTTLTVTGNATISGILSGNMLSTTTDAFDFTLGAGSSDQVIFFQGVGATSTLPAVTNTGAHYRFSILAAFGTEDATVASAEGDNINGSLFVNDAIVACSGEDRIQFINDGEAIGDFVELISDGTNWNIINSRGETAAKLICDDNS